MPKDNEASLSGEKTFQGQSKPTPKASDLDTGSLGDQATYAGRRPVAAGQSLGDQVTFCGEDAAEADFVDDGMEVFDLSTRYKIESTLGKGGMGEVLLATNTRLERKVAIKRIPGEAARSRTAISRFLTEAKSIADGVHSVAADADGADEDGITFGVVRPGQLDATVIVNVQNAPRRVKILRRTQNAVKHGTYGSPESRISAA